MAPSNSFSSTLSFLLLLAPATLVSADCTNFTLSSSQMDTAYTNHSDHPAITLYHLSCPSSSNKPCVFQRHACQITVPARLNISASAADNSSILALASEASEFDGTHPLFIDRNISVDTNNIGKTYVEVNPGENGTLEWVPYLLHSVGTLEGCSNSSLNGMVVEATAPYLASSTNGILVDGFQEQYRGQGEHRR